MGIACSFLFRWLELFMVTKMLDAATRLCLEIPLKKDIHLVCRVESLGAMFI